MKQSALSTGGRGFSTGDDVWIASLRSQMPRSYSKRHLRMDCRIKSGNDERSALFTPPSGTQPKCNEDVRRESGIIRTEAIWLSPRTGDGLVAATKPRGLTMCDFSLQHAKSRPAVVADKLVSHNFGRGTVGFKAVDDPIGEATAVCILPGTELAFDKPLKLRWSADEAKSLEGFTTAIFRQRDKDKPSMHHDVLEMPDGQQILLTHLEEGQTATVLQLPAAPRTQAEAEEQTRAEFAG